jgi:hypothetical protein
MTDWVIAELETRPVVEEVMAERLRQVDKEGWSHEHDDEHTEFELTRAAVAYALAATATPEQPTAEDMGEVWPWDPLWWKPSSPRRNLVKAAALIIAEIERLDRAEHKAD